MINKKIYFVTFFQQESQAITDESKDHWAVDESLVEQKICGSVSITFVVRKTGPILLPASGSYGRQADEILVDLKVLKFCTN